MDFSRQLENFCQFSSALKVEFPSCGGLADTQAANDFVKFIIIYTNGYKKMPQSGVASMQGKNTGNMPSTVCASSINKFLDPTPI